VAEKRIGSALNRITGSGSVCSDASASLMLTRNVRKTRNFTRARLMRWRSRQAPVTQSEIAAN